MTDGIRFVVLSRAVLLDRFREEEHSAGGDKRGGARHAAIQPLRQSPVGIVRQHSLLRQVRGTQHAPCSASHIQTSPDELETFGIHDNPFLSSPGIQLALLGAQELCLERFLVAPLVPTKVQSSPITYPQLYQFPLFGD